MTENASNQGYVFRGDEQYDQMMRARSVSTEAAFAMPFLKAGQDVVDFGCGQGTITVGIAKAVAPGHVLGFDAQAEHIDRARSLAANKGLVNVEFLVGDIYHPPCEPDSWDVIYANAVLSHLRDPEEALRIMHLVLKPRGLVALRDRGGAPTYIGHPDVHTDGYRLVESVMDAVSQNPFGSQNIGIVLNRLCREAGLEVVNISASWSVETGANAASNGIRDRLPATLAARALALGHTTEAELAEINERYRQWQKDPDAYLAVPWFEVVARKQ